MIKIILETIFYMNVFSIALFLPEALIDGLEVVLTYPARLFEILNQRYNFVGTSILLLIPLVVYPTAFVTVGLIWIIKITIKSAVYLFNLCFERKRKEKM